MDKISLNRIKSLIFSKWTLVISILFVSLFFIIVLTTSIFIILMQQGVILIGHADSIQLPNGKNLYDLQTFTYRDGALHGYNYQYLILDEEEEEEFVNVISMGNGNHERLISISRHFDWSEDEFTCSGKCECFESEIELIDRRSVGSLIYSYRFTSVLVLSTIGFAAAKFVNDHMDECYELAERVTGKDKYSITCDVEEVSCEGKEELNEKMEKVWCYGHCILNDNVFDRARERMGLNLDRTVSAWGCEEKSGKSEHIPVPRSVTLKRDSTGTLLYAKTQYAAKFLHPYCTTNLVELRDDVTGDKYNICKGDGGPDYRNVKCEFESNIVDPVKNGPDADRSKKWP